MSSLVKNAKDQYDQLVKILLIGNSGVGKTQILLRYVENHFSTSYLSTIGIDFKIKKLQVDDKIIKMQIWDTAGQERYKTITQNYYKGAKGIILVFALNDKETFNDIEKWLTQIKLHASQNIIKMLIGNKADLPDKCITSKDALNFAEQHQIPYFETSAKDGTNVNEMFYQIAKLIKESSPQQLSPDNNSTKLTINNSDQREEASSCC